MDLFNDSISSFRPWITGPDSISGICDGTTIVGEFALSAGLANSRTGTFGTSDVDS